MASKPIRLGRKDVETFLDLLKRGLSNKPITYRLAGSGHVLVCNQHGVPYVRDDGREFTIPTTPAPHGKWRQRALRFAVDVGLVDKEVLTTGKRRSAEELARERLAKIEAEAREIRKRFPSLAA